MDNRQIGIFDSGVGGLTVTAAIAKLLPQERLVYLGDTARLPYGTKSAETVSRYAVQATRALMRFDVKLIVVACNTASAVALPVLTAALAPVPIIGVVEPGARAAVDATHSGRIAVIATEGTVRGGAYVRAIHALMPEAHVEQKACPLFVALAEEGWTEGDVPESAARRYLGQMFAQDEAPDTLVLGCTHFPLIAGVVRRHLPPSTRLLSQPGIVAGGRQPGETHQERGARLAGKCARGRDLIDWTAGCDAFWPVSDGRNLISRATRRDCYV